MTTPATTALRAQKRAMRTLMKRTLAALPSADVQSQSDALAEHLFAASFWAPARTVCVYLSMPSGELDTRRIVDMALRAGKYVYVPKMVPATALPNIGTPLAQKKDLMMLRVHSEADLASFPRDSWGIPDPPQLFGDAPRAHSGVGELDIVLVPGVAFDRNMNRLGHGAGFYDRFLSRLNPRPFTVGLALRQQLQDSVPSGDADVRIDAVLTPEGFVYADNTDVDQNDAAALPTSGA